MIEITEAAIEKIQTLQGEDQLKVLLAGQGVPLPAPLRVGVRPGGCSGFSYDLFFDMKGEQLNDEVADIAGIIVLIDHESARLLEGATLDYREGLQGAGFKFTNPNSSRTCGCGESFS